VCFVVKLFVSAPSARSAVARGHECSV